MQLSYGLLSIPLPPGCCQGGHAAGRGGHSRRNPLPLLARDRLEAGASPHVMGCRLLFPLHPAPSAHLSYHTEHSPSHSARWPCHQGLLLGLSSHPPSQTTPCLAPLFLLGIPFISTSSLNCPIRPPLLLPTALQHHKSGRSLVGSGVMVLRGWGTMHSVGRKGDCSCQQPNLRNLL